MFDAPKSSKTITEQAQACPLNFPAEDDIWIHLEDLFSRGRRMMGGRGDGVRVGNTLWFGRHKQRAENTHTTKIKDQKKTRNPKIDTALSLGKHAPQKLSSKRHSHSRLTSDTNAWKSSASFRKLQLRMFPLR